MRPVRAAFTLAALLFAGLACSAQAAPRRIPLSPPASEVAFRAYGAGLLPIDATFARFDGWLTYDPDDRASCQVELHVQVASMVTEDQAMRATIVGPDFMDAASFPDLTYTGSCGASGARRHAGDARDHQAIRAVTGLEAATAWLRKAGWSERNGA